MPMSKRKMFKMYGHLTNTKDIKNLIEKMSENGLNVSIIAMNQFFVTNAN